MKLRFHHQPRAAQRSLAQGERELSKQPSKDLQVDGRPEKKTLQHLFIQCHMAFPLSANPCPSVVQGPLAQQVSVVPVVRAWLQLLNSH